MGKTSLPYLTTKSANGFSLPFLLWPHLLDLKKLNFPATRSSGYILLTLINKQSQLLQICFGAKIFKAPNFAFGRLLGLNSIGFSE